MSNLPAINQSDVTAFVKDQIMAGASDSELQAFLMVARATGLDPMRRQVFAVKRAVRQRDGSYRDQWSTQCSIDGFRAIAESSGDYEGQAGPFWCGADGVWKDVWISNVPPMAAKVGVWRKGFRDPLYRIATWSEYYQKGKDGKPTKFWAAMPSLMLAKCFDEKTEILTDKGFQLFSQVTGNVLQVTENGLEKTDSKPFRQNYSGEMITLESDDLNFSVTPNHDMVTTAGKIEAGELFISARARPKFWIPRVVRNKTVDSLVSDREIQLAAAYLADGYPQSGSTGIISVSREYKIEVLNNIGGFTKTDIKKCSGNIAKGKSGREILTSKDRTSFFYDYKIFSHVCDVDKNINFDSITSFSARQARLFVDTLIYFDGADNGQGVMRFYSSNDDIMSAFELASVIAGLSVSNRHERYSDLSDRVNYQVTISDRSDIPVIRWGREYKGNGGNHKERTGLELTKNDTGVVWCVTVPSGEIVVRRNGFSMRCGNCAEALALRAAFPQKLSGVYTSDEMPQEVESEVIEEPKPRPMAVAPRIQAQVEAQKADPAPQLNKLIQRAMEGGPIGARNYAEAINWPSDKPYPNCMTFVIPIGKNKGKMVLDIPEKDLRNLAEYFVREHREGKSLSPAAVDTVGAIQDYIDSRREEIPPPPSEHDMPKFSDDEPMTLQI